TDDRILRAPGTPVTMPPKQGAAPAASSSLEKPRPIAAEPPERPRPIAAEPPERPSAPDPGLKPSTFLVRCDACDAEAYAVDLGPVRGVLGLIADHRAFIAPKSGRVVTAPQL